MDGPSWELFGAIRDSSLRLAIVLIQLCDDNGELIVASESKNSFNQVWFAKSMDTLRL